MCLYLIYCFTHVESFRFFLAANIVAAPINFRKRAQYTYVMYSDYGVCVLHIATERARF